MLYHNDEKGYTLVELIIAVAIGIVLISAASATYVSQSRAFRTQENVSEVNSQSKIAHNIMSNNIRSAGFGRPDDMNILETPVNGFSNVITPVDNTAAPDAVTILGGLRFVGMIFPQGVGMNAIACPNKTPKTATVISLVSPSNEEIEVPVGAVLSIDGFREVNVTNCVQELDGSCDSQFLTINPPLANDFTLTDEDGDGLCDSGRPVYMYEDYTYCVDGNGSLRRIRGGANVAACTGLAGSTDDVLVDNVEDVQFSYAVDANFDNQVDDQNGNGTIDAGDFLDNPADPRSIKAVRINVLSRTDVQDVNFAGQGNPPAAIENRNHAATNDGFRRRWLQSMVKIRNR